MTADTSPGAPPTTIPVGTPHVPLMTSANARAATVSTSTTDECGGIAPHNCSTAATSPAPVVRNASPDRARRGAGFAGRDSAIPNVIAAGRPPQATPKPPARRTPPVRAGPARCGPPSPHPRAPPGPPDTPPDP